MTFLQQTAAYISNHLSGAYDSVLVITPNKRTGIFLKGELEKQLDKPGILPKVITIEDFIEQNSQFAFGEELELNLILYEIFQKHLPIYESFDEFYYWGEMLIRDFNDIDKNLVTAEDLFQLMLDEKEIDKQFQYLLPEQIDIIKKFWRSFSSPDHDRNQQSFIDTWSSLLPIYKEFKDKLASKKMAYKGMAFREVSEQISNLKIEIPFDRILFVGFHILSLSEENIFRFFHKNKTGMFFWDTDKYYLNMPKSQIKNHEAGAFLRKYVKWFPNSIEPSDMKATPPEIHFISCPKTTSQTLAVNKILKERKIEYNERTAVILPQEDVLVPMLQSIASPDQPINITLGYSLKNSTIYALVEYWLGIFKYKSGNKYYYKPFLRLLNNAYVKSLYPDETSEFEAFMVDNNLIYVTDQEVQQFPFLKTFVGIDHNNSSVFIKSVTELIERIYYFYFDQKDQTALKKFEIEVLYQTLQAFYKLNSILDDGKVKVEMDTLKKLIFKYLNKLSVNFAGEPVQGLQVMGLLESRNLDFENVFILNANEGVLPAGISSGSYIPYHLRAGFHLPTYQNNDCMYAYYVYRLLHRAKNVYFLHNNVVDERSKAEPSRYIVQLQLESGMPFKSYHQQIEFKTPETKKIIIPKTDEIIEVLSGYYTKESSKRLSPSSLNTYLDCRLKFYFRYIKNLKEPDTIKDEIDPAIFGNLLHNSLQNLYTYYQEKTGKSIIEETDITILRSLTSEAIKTAINLEFSHPEKIREISLVGDYLVIFNIIEEYVNNIIDIDVKKLPLKVPQMEEDYNFNFDISSEGAVKNVKIGGRVDRLEEDEDQVLVVDYKSGKAETKNSFSSVYDLFDRESTRRKENLFQIFLYSYLLGKDVFKGKKVVPQLLFIRDSYQHNFDSSILHKPSRGVVKKVESVGEYADDFATELTRVLEELFDSTTPFNQTDQDHKCQFCAYKEICNR